MTIVAEVRELVDQYHTWLRDKGSLRAVNAQWTEIVTPFLDRHNDYIVLYAAKKDDVYELTDDGYTISDLAISGCTLDTPRRKAILQTALNGFGVELRDGVLIVKARKDNFALRKHAIVQAILAINDLFYLSNPMVRSLFKEDVAAWLETSNVRFLQNVQFAGHSGYTHFFDFAIPKSRDAPERLIKAIANPTKDVAQSMIFSWMDTRQVRDDDSRALAILNDRERPISSGIVDAFSSYDITPILWTNRTKAQEQVTA